MISPNPRACCFSRLIPWKNKGLSGPVGEVTGNEGGTSGNYPQTGATPGRVAQAVTWAWRYDIDRQGYSQTPRERWRQSRKRVQGNA